MPASDTLPPCDVLVVGGGPGGLAAAISAARIGADTLLVERYGFLGGMATAALVNPFMTFWAGDEQIVEGILQEIIDRLFAMGAYGKGSRTAFDPEALKFVADRMCEESGVRLLFHSTATDVSVEGSSVSAVEFHSKSGKTSASAKVYVDATGDADLAALGGVPFEIGRTEDGLTQPMTLMFRVGNVDASRMPTKAEIDNLFRTAQAEGRVNIPREGTLYLFTTRSDEILFNTTRIIGADGTDAVDLTRGEIEGRRQAWEILAFLRRDVTGFENSEILASGPQIGVRESRRIVGEYTLTAEDVLSAHKFSDGIARGSYCIDIHNPTGAGTLIQSLPPGESYDIPYRCLVPVGIDNLLVSGRPISATHEAHASLRVMPTCVAIGQAAGTSAALCAMRGASPRSLDTSLLRATLRDWGANLGPHA